MDIIKELESLKEEHYICEDCWYSCPKSEEGCCDEQYSKDVCTCGADNRNSKIDLIIAELLNKGLTR